MRVEFSLLCVSRLFVEISKLLLLSDLVSVLSHVIQPHKNVDGIGVVLRVVESDESKLLGVAAAHVGSRIVVIHKELLGLAIARVFGFFFGSCLLLSAEVHGLLGLRNEHSGAAARLEVGSTRVERLWAKRLEAGRSGVDRWCGSSLKLSHDGEEVEQARSKACVELRLNPCGVCRIILRIVTFRELLLRNATERGEITGVEVSRLLRGAPTSGDTEREFLRHLVIISSFSELFNYKHYENY
jgi:hypothetical protein